MFDKDISDSLQKIKEFLGDNFVSFEKRIIDNELSIFVTTKEHEIDRKKITEMCLGMCRLFEIDFPKDNINQFMIYLRGVQNDIDFKLI